MKAENVRTRPGAAVVSGNLSSPRRTIQSTLSQMNLFGIERPDAVGILDDVGLPERAFDEPDFPISIDQDLTMLNAMLDRLDRSRSHLGVLFALAPHLGINLFGVLGLAMQHAAGLLEAVETYLTCPQLGWGRSRLAITRRSAAIYITFSMERPALAGLSPVQRERLVEYAVTLDLLAASRNIDDILGGAVPLQRIWLPFDKPFDWEVVRGFAPCPVRFGAAEAALIYPERLLTAVPPKSNPLVFRSYVKVARTLSLMLADESGLAEQVTRWLWAYSPPLKRGEIARLLGLSERSLARRLNAEGTSYNRLFARVQAERARNLLGDPAMPITTIAERLGYSEPAAFSRAFTAWTGMSPKRWRRDGLA